MSERVEIEARSEWNSDPKIEKEFGKFPTYLAYRKAAANGAAKVFGANKVITGEPAASGHTVSKPSIAAICAPAERLLASRAPAKPVPADVSPAAKAYFADIAENFANGIATLREKFGVDIKRLDWKPGEFVARLS